MKPLLSLGILIVLSLLAVLPAEAATQNIVLSWQDLPNEDSYIIERKNGPNGTYAPLGTTAQNVLTFKDVNVAQGTNFCYHIIGKNQLANGAPSDDFCIVSAGIPGKVGGLNAVIEIIP